MTTPLPPFTQPTNRVTVCRAARLLWQRAASPAGDTRRLHLPDRCDRAWFCKARHCSGHPRPRCSVSRLGRLVGVACSSSLQSWAFAPAARFVALRRRGSVKQTQTTTVLVCVRALGRDRARNLCVRSASRRSAAARAASGPRTTPSGTSSPASTCTTRQPTNHRCCDNFARDAVFALRSGRAVTGNMV